MSRATNKERAQRLAAYLAKHSPVRLVGNCPMCHRVQSLTGLRGHINTCRGRR